MKIKIVLITSIILSLLSSCVTPKDTNLLQDIPKNYPMAENITNSDYKIIPGDQLALTIYTLDEDMKDLFSMYIGKSNSNNTSGLPTSSGTQNESQPNSLNVYSDGTINVPYLGKIYVQDLTVLEAKKIIEARFLTFSPNITIELSLQNRYFSVLGKISPKKIGMPSPKITIFQALALAGSIDTFGDRTKVRIIRQTPNGTEVKIFDLRSKDIVNSEYYYIQPNDVIYIQEMSRTFFGRVTSFTGVLGLFGIVTTLVAGTALIIRLTK